MTIRSVAAMLALVAIAGVFSPAHAQLGSLGKKLAKKATEKVTGKSMPAPGEPGSVGSDQAYAPAVIGTPLTADTLTRVLKGLAEMNALLAKNEGLSAQQGELQGQLNASIDAHAKEKSRYDDAVEKVESCQRDVLAEKEKEHERIASQKMTEMQSDPQKGAKMATEMSEMSRKISDLQQKGDVAAAEALMKDFYRRVLGIDFKADTAAAVAKCGSRPAKPAFLVEQERMTAQVDALQKQIRDAEQGAQSMAAKSAGLSPGRFALARERLMTWRASGGRGDKHFSDDENALLAAHREEIQQAARALR